MKDNLIDEEKAKQEEAAQENLLQKIDRSVPGRQPQINLYWLYHPDWTALWKASQSNSPGCWLNTPASRSVSKTNRVVQCGAFLAFRCVFKASESLTWSWTLTLTLIQVRVKQRLTKLEVTGEPGGGDDIIETVTTWSLSLYLQPQTLTSYYVILDKKYLIETLLVRTRQNYFVSGIKCDIYLLYNDKYNTL